jgi:hypothetical protein
VLDSVSQLQRADDKRNHSDCNRNELSSRSESSCNVNRLYGQQTPVACQDSSQIRI